MAIMVFDSAIDIIGSILLVASGIRCAQRAVLFNTWLYIEKFDYVNVMNGSYLMMRVIEVVPHAFAAGLLI